VVSSVLVLPAMLCQAELASAMPHAGGAYFFLDRAFGPLAGTVTGVGLWTVRVLKSAFALIGIGAGEATSAQNLLVLALLGVCRPDEGGQHRRRGAQPGTQPAARHGASAACRRRFYGAGTFLMVS
jgi:ketopantoate hydroxymethyltransferase